MYATSLIKQAFNPGMAAPYNGNPYTAPTSMYGPAQGGISNTDALLMGLLGRGMGLKKRNNSGSFYDYSKSNPDSMSHAGMAGAYQTHNPERWARIEAAREDLKRSGGRGWINVRHGIQGSMDPKLMLDALLATPRMDDKMSMLAALKRDHSTAAKKAITFINKSAPGLIRPEMKERFWRIEPGKQTIGGNFDLLNNAPMSAVPGNRFYNSTVKAKLQRNWDNVYNKNIVRGGQAIGDGFANMGNKVKSWATSWDPYDSKAKRDWTKPRSQF